MTSYLGGDRLTVGERHALVRRVLAPLSAVDLGLRWQCFCGATRYVRYRRYFYCQRCGHRQDQPDVRGYHDTTFRQAFESAERDMQVTTRGCCPRCRSTRLTLHETTYEEHTWFDGLLVVDGEIRPKGEAVRRAGDLVPSRTRLECQGCGHVWRPRRSVGDPITEAH